jgi:hypothetical protein
MATAELAVAMPAVALLLVLALSTLSSAVDHIRCVDAARAAARIMARGEGEADATRAARALAPSGSSVVLSSESTVVRVIVTAPGRWGLRWLGVSARPSAEAVAAREDTATGGVP